MDELQKKQKQLNTALDADFTVDDIVREFGSGAQDPSAPAPRPPKAASAAKGAESKRAAEKGARIAQSEKTKEDRRREQLHEWEKKQAAKEAAAAQRAARRAASAARAEEKAGTRRQVPPRSDSGPWLSRRKLLRQTPPPEKEFPSPEEAAQSYAARSRSLRISSAAAWALMVLSAAVTVLQRVPQLGLDAYLPPALVGICALLVLLCHCVLALPVLRGGVEALLKGRFTAGSLLAVTAIVTCIREFAGLSTGTVSLAPAASFLLTVALWGEQLLALARARTLRLALAMDEPLAAARFRDEAGDRDCLLRTRAEPDGLTEELERQPGAEKTVNVVSALLAAASLTAAVIFHLRAGRNFLWVWNVILLGVCPLGGMTAFGRCFSLASRRLKNLGAALRGWPGADRLSGAADAVITDADLFPPANVTMNGIKMYSDYSPERLLGYGAAILQRSGAEVLSDLFLQVLESQNGRHYRVDNFRAYDAGGLGAEIQGDVVLMGGMGFMQTMGVQPPSEALPKQALYISVNGAVAGVFVINYQPAGPVRAGLAALLGSRGLSPVLATRDVLLTPESLRQKYGLPTDRLAYPMTRERGRLAAGFRGKGQQGAFLARGSFLAFAMTVRTGRQLRRSVPAAAAVSLTGAVIGFFLMTLLTLIGAVDSANALNIMAYHVIWLVPWGLITGLVGK